MLELPSEPWLARSLRVPCALASATRPCPPSALSEREHEHHRRLGGERRAAVWLRGRSAWKALLRRFGEDEDTARFALPSARFSVTHSGRSSVVVGVPEGHALGIGVDLEQGRVPRAAAARFFLRHSEELALLDLDPARRGRWRLCLWTVKEAVFKADPANRDRILTDYRLSAPLAWSGLARAVHGAAAIRYACFSLPCGALSVAVLPFR